jgi:acetyl-CoA synthetase
MSEETFHTWVPNADQLANANVTRIMKTLDISDYEEFRQFSTENPERYWETILEFTGIKWVKPYETFVDFSKGREFPEWFQGGVLNWTDTIFAWAKDPEHASRIALIAEYEDGKTVHLTYPELHDEVRKFARGLLKLGVEKGDRVGLLMEPCVESVVSMISLSYMGAVVLPMFSGFGTEPIASRLALCKAKALVTTEGFTRRGGFVDRTAAATEAAKTAGVEFLIMKPVKPGELKIDGAIDWYDVAKGPAMEPDAEPMSTQDNYMVFFTSGTTGKPKGIVHTHGGFPIKVLHDSVLHFDTQEDDIFFWPADMGWVAGAMIIVSVMMRGATMVVFDGAPNYPDWSRMSRMIERHKVTQFGGAPTMIRGFATNSEQALAGDVSTVRVLITGGETIDAQHFAWYQEHFGHGVAPLINFSGGTEVSSGLVSSVMLKPILAGGFNTTCPGVEVDVIDEKGNSVYDEVGELAIRAPFVGMTKSFWEDDERYLDTYWRTIPGIWVHGDLAVQDRDGNFFLKGRSDDTLKLAGKRTGPAEIEDVLIELPDVVEVAAIGVPDEAKGEVLVVFVVASEGINDSEKLIQEVMDHADKRLGRAFRPAKVHVVAELPKTRTAKIMRRLIRAIYCDLPLGDTSALDNSTAVDVVRAAAGR